MQAVLAIRLQKKTAMTYMPLPVVYEAIERRQLYNIIIHCLLIYPEFLIQYFIFTDILMNGGIWALTISFSWFIPKNHTGIDFCYVSGV